jgi:hypothetical protein
METALLRMTIAAAAAVGLTATLAAQDAAPRFEVASVKHRDLEDPTLTARSGVQCVYVEGPCTRVMPDCRRLRCWRSSAKRNGLLR